MPISNNVMKMSEWESAPAITYRLGCDCGSPECDIRLSVEVDHDYLTLLFYKKLISANYSDSKFKNFRWRIKSALKILFLGWIEAEECLMLRGEEHINSFIQALEEGKAFIRENQK